MSQADSKRNGPQANFQFYPGPCNSPSGLEGGVGTLPPGFSQFVHQNKGLNLKILPNERAMLSIFMNKIQVADPDIIVGHAIKDHDLDVMMHRMAASKVNSWSKLGRSKLSKFPVPISEVLTQG